MKYIAQILFLFASHILFSQEGKWNSNIILLIDEEVCVGSIANIQIQKSSGEKVDVEYVPGNLTLDKSLYNELMENEKDIV